MARKKKAPAVTPVVYVGPTLPGGVLQHLTVFRGDGFPAHVAEIIENKPALRGLIVPVSQLSEALMAVKTRGHILNTYAREIARQGG